MEDADEQAVTPLNGNWISSVLAGFSFQSLLTRQILSAISGLLVNLIITPLVVRFIDVDFRASSLKRALLVSLVSMLLAFAFKYWKKLSRNSSYAASWMDMDVDTAGSNDEINPKDYSVFTSFRFPVPDNLLPAPPRPVEAEETTEVENEWITAPIPVCSEPRRLSTSSSEPRQTPPPPSYQPQWVTSIPSSSHRRFLPSAPPSPMNGKGKFAASRKKNRSNKGSPKTSLLHQSLLNPTYTYRASKPFETRFREQEAGTLIPPKKGNRNSTYRDHNKGREASASTPQRSSWAWDFMEETSFAKFQSDYAKFRSINSSSLGAFKTRAVPNEAPKRHPGRDASDAIQPNRAPASVGKEDHQLQKPAPAQALVPLQLQIHSSKPYDGGRKTVGTKTNCSGCLKTCLSLFSIKRKRELRSWNSRRYRQISHAPLLWSPVHPPQGSF